MKIFKFVEGLYENLHKENAKFYDYSLRILALKLRDNPI